MQNYPSYLAKSFTDSVLPVPAGPYIEEPNFIERLLVIVIQQRSVRGVITNLVDTPIYS